MEDSRRNFVKAALGIFGGLFLISMGAARTMFLFFFGPRLNQKDESEFMEFKLKQLKLATQQRELELEREERPYILVAPLAELDSTAGKYFIDYQMCPAIALKGDDGLPNLISAKCTHLGCTVGNQVSDGKILCPCHLSYFSVKTGEPNPNSPAKAPLPHIAWVIKDNKGNILAQKTGSGKMTGTADPSKFQDAKVYICRNDAESGT